MTRKEQAAKTRKHILDITQQLLGKKTLDELSINEICEASGVSVGTFYHYFENKASLIIEIYKDIDILFKDKILPEILSKEPVEAILLYIQAQCQYGVEVGLDIVKNVFKAQIDYGNHFFLSKDRELPQGLKSLVLRAQRENMLDPSADAENVTTQLLIISRGIVYNWCVSDGSIDITETVQQIVSKFLEGYGCAPKHIPTFIQ